METIEDNSYAGMGTNELGRELAEKQGSLHLGKAAARELRRSTPIDTVAIEAERTARQEALRCAQALAMELARRRKLNQTPPGRIKLIGY